MPLKPEEMRVGRRDEKEVAFADPLIDLAEGGAGMKIPPPEKPRHGDE